MTEKKPKDKAVKRAVPKKRAASAKAAEKGSAAGKRVRGSIYGPRKTISLRLEEVEHAAVMKYCDEAKLVANTYILDLIRADLRKKKLL